MRGRLGQFFISEEGTTSVEYAIIASLIFLSIVAAVASLGGSIRGLYESVAAGFP
jgi:pilus assembly protein Flp/PilA